MPSGQLRQENQILARIIAGIVARSGLIDLNDTSLVKGLAAGTAREIGDVYYQLLLLRDIFDIDTAVGTDLDERAKEIQPGTLRRRGARRSVGTIVLSRATNTGTTLTVPPGVVVKTSTGISVRTTEQAIVTNTSAEQITGHGVGRDSAPVSAVAVDPGEEGNVDTGTLIEFDAKPLGIVSATNTAAFVFGRDRESDEEFRTRIRQFVTSLARCTPDAIKYGVLGIEDPVTSKTVQFAHVFEDPVARGNVTLYIDDGAGTAEDTAAIAAENVTAGLAGPPADSAVGGEEFLSLDEAPIRIESTTTVTSSTRGALTADSTYYLNPTDGTIYFSPALVNAETITASYTHFTGLIDYIQRIINGDSNDRINFPGLAAAGIRVRVRAPVVIVPHVQAIVFVAEGFDRDSVIAAAQTRVLNYINTRGISGDVIRHKLIEVIMATPGVTDCVLIAPSANITTLDNEIPRSQAADIDID